MAQKTLLTLDEFFAMPENGHDYELVHGELVEMPPQSFRHEYSKSKIVKALVAYFLKHDLGMVLPETGATLDEDSWRKPDVSVLMKDRLDRQDMEGPIQGAPDLCVEVVSPSNTNRELADKTAHFLKAGATAVWVAYPVTKEIHVVTKGADRWLGPDDTLTQPDLLPGFEVRAGSLFERD